MYDRLKRLYDAGTLTTAGLKNAVVRGRITAEQFEEITGVAFETA